MRGSYRPRLLQRFFFTVRLFAARLVAQSVETLVDERTRFQVLGSALLPKPLYFRVRALSGEGESADLSITWPPEAIL